MLKGGFLGRLQSHLWIFPLLALAAVIIGQICETQCAYISGDILGIDLNLFGILFYSFLVASVLFYKKYYPKEWVLKAIAAVVSVGAGAEVVLIKFQIQHDTYCPKCLVSGFFFLVLFFLLARQLRAWVVALLVAAGILFASLTFSGSVIPTYGKDIPSPLFGNPAAPVEIIVYSDYFCPACLSVEEQINRKLLQLKGKTRIRFIDVPMHKESREYAEAFLYAWFGTGNDLEKAVAVRSLLFDAAQAKRTQKEALSILKSRGIPFKEDKERAKEVFMNVYNDFLKTDKIKATPTVVVAEGNKRKVYKGSAEIIKGLESITAR